MFRFFLHRITPHLTSIHPASKSSWHTSSLVLSQETPMCHTVTMPLVNHTLPGLHDNTESEQSNSGLQNDLVSSRLRPCLSITAWTCNLLSCGTRGPVSKALLPPPLSTVCGSPLSHRTSAPSGASAHTFLSVDICKQPGPCDSWHLCSPLPRFLALGL